MDVIPSLGHLNPKIGTVKSWRERLLTQEGALTIQIHLVERYHVKLQELHLAALIFEGTKQLLLGFVITRVYCNSWDIAFFPRSIPLNHVQGIWRELACVIGS